MALQSLKIIRRPTLNSIASMDEVIRNLGKEAEANGYTVVRTEIQYDTTARQCTIELLAEKRGST